MLFQADFAKLDLAAPSADTTRRAAYRDLATGDIELGRLWQLLVIGELTIVSSFSLADRSFAELALGTTPRPRSEPRPLDSLLFKRILEGECPKAVAAEVGMSASGLNTRCTTLLNRMGCESSTLRTVPLVSMAALAARGMPLGRARVEGFSQEGVIHWLVSVSSPAESLRGRLSPSEYAIAQFVIDGKRTTEIAAARGTTARTIANQLSSIFRKLNVSGRSALRAHAIRAQASRLMSHQRGEADRHSDSA